MIPLAPAQRNKRLGLSYGGFVLLSRKMENLGEAASLRHADMTLRACVYKAVGTFVPGCMCVLEK